MLVFCLCPYVEDSCFLFGVEWCGDSGQWRACIDMVHQGAEAVSTSSLTHQIQPHIVILNNLFNLLASSVATICLCPSELWFLFNKTAIIDSAQTWCDEVRKWQLLDQRTPHQPGIGNVGVLVIPSLKYTAQALAMLAMLVFLLSQVSDIQPVYWQCWCSCCPKSQIYTAQALTMLVFLVSQVIDIYRPDTGNVGVLVVPSLRYIQPMHLQCWCSCCPKSQIDTATQPHKEVKGQTRVS